MSHNSYFMPLGIWGLVTVVPSSALQYFDQTLFKCINGDEGGTWAPSSVITIGGSGLAVTGSFIGGTATFSGKVTCNGTVWIGDNAGDILEVFATPVFNESAGFNGGLVSTEIEVLGASTLASVTCSSLAASGAVSCATLSAGSLAVAGATVCAGSITANGGLVVNGNASVSGSSALHAVSCAGTLTVAGGASVTSTVTYSGAGRGVREAQIGAGSGGGTASPQQATVYWFVAGMSTQSYALGTVGVVDGDEIEISLEPGVVSTLTITGGAHGTLAMTNNGSGSVFYSRWKRIVGAWQLLSVAVIP